MERNSHSMVFEADTFEMNWRREVSEGVNDPPKLTNGERQYFGVILDEKIGEPGRTYFPQKVRTP